jgi:hypothetical protein
MLRKQVADPACYEGILRFPGIIAPVLAATSPGAKAKG